MTTQTRWIPKDSTEITHALGVAYVYQYENGPRKVMTFAVCAYHGKAIKGAVHESYRTAELRNKRVQELFTNWQAHEDYKAKSRADRGKPHTLKPGDILHHSWGWEQTQCDYYQIISVTDHTATIRAIADETVPGSTYQHGMADMRTAVKDSFCGEPFRVKVNGYGNVCVGDGPLSHGCCNLWDGKPNYCSWYA